MSGRLRSPRPAGAGSGAVRMRAAVCCVRMWRAGRGDCGQGAESRAAAQPRVSPASKRSIFAGRQARRRGVVRVRGTARLSAPGSCSDVPVSPVRHGGGSPGRSSGGRGGGGEWRSEDLTVVVARARARVYGLVVGWSPLRLAVPGAALVAASPACGGYSSSAYVSSERCNTAAGSAVQRAPRCASPLCPPLTTVATSNSSASSHSPLGPLNLCAVRRGKIRPSPSPTP